MARPSRSYKEYLLQRLHDPAEAAEYINGALEGGGMPELMMALRDVAEARGVGHVAARAGLNRENVYRMLSDKGNPRLSSMLPLLSALGVEIHAQPLKPAVVKAASVKASLACDGASVKATSSDLEEYEEEDGENEGGDFAADDESVAA
jgi:probable addiction module antidote protein